MSSFEKSKAHATPVGWALLLVVLMAHGFGCRPIQSEGTLKMVAWLGALADSTDTMPERNLYHNNARVRVVKQLDPGPLPRDQARYARMLGQELLRANQNLEAARQFERVLQISDQNPGMFTRAYRLAVLDYLAITYMRLGEQDNCLENHNIDRCLFPIQGQGFHTIERGSRRATEIYRELLEEEPDDLNYLWLLNLAHMTLNEYPEGVPERWRIPPENLEDEGELKRFRDVAPYLGLDNVTMSGGVVMEDFNGDGHLDLMTSAWGLRDQLRYFENNRDGTFTDRTEHAGVVGLYGGLNLTHADYDNDGDRDVLILRGAWVNEGHPNSLLRNRGDGTFDDVTEEAGILSFHPTQTAAWGDFDNDGLLDVFIGNESSQWSGVHPCELYRNNGDGTFTDVAPDLHLDIVYFAKSVSWGDINNDGRQDLLISSWVEPQLLFRNDGAAEDGSWQFTEIGASAGVREPVESFPAWFWDYDNDGWQDIFVSGWRASCGQIAAERLGLQVTGELPRMYRNLGNETFEDVTPAANLQKLMLTMGHNFGDIDNDGWLDFYVGTGDPDFRSLIPNRMFRNVNGKVFEEVTGSGGFGHLQKGHGIAFGDLDNDGDQDIFAQMGGAFEGDAFANALFENPGFGNHWITLHLEGRVSNRDAFGTRIHVAVDTLGGERSIYITVGTGGSFGSSSLRQEIGLGNASQIRYVELTWPITGEVQRFNDLELDSVYRLRESSMEPEALTPTTYSFVPQTVDATPHDHQ